MLICTLGDLLLDVIVQLDAPLAPGADTGARTHTGAGGQAANVAAWVAELGGRGRFVGKRAGDAAGLVAAAELEARGAEVVGPVAAGRSGVVVSLVSAGGARTMVSDRGVCPELEPEELDPAWLDGCARLHVSGYSLLLEPIASAAERAAQLAHAAGAAVSVDLSPWTTIRDLGPDRFAARLLGLAPDLLFANEEECEQLGGELPAPLWVLKRGARGCVVGSGPERLELPAVDAVAVDSTGAGDALAAGFLLGGSNREAAERGLAAAARCVGQLGSMP